MISKILVTGCGGYIGTTLTGYLLEKKYEIICVDTLFFGEDLIVHLKEHDNFHLVKKDVRELLPEDFTGVDAVVDMAAIANDPSGELNPTLTYDINYKARVRNAILGKKAGVKKYILISSCSVYGRQKNTVNENAPLNPLTVYSKANMMAENEVLPLNSREYSVTVLRLATVFGFSRRMRFDLVVNAMTLNAFLKKEIIVEGDGSQERPLIHVIDVARAVKKVLEAEREIVGGQIFNVGSNNQNYKIIDIARKVKEIVGGKITYRGELDKRTYRVSFDKIREQLSYTTMYDLDYGVKEVYHALLSGFLKPEDRWITVKWYKRLLQQRPKDLTGGHI